MKNIKRIISALLTVIFLAFAISVTAAPSASFIDVEADRWSYSDIAYAVEKGFLKGVGGGRFAPEEACTRAMVVTVLYRAEGEPQVTARSPFTDVPSGEWYYDAVRWAQMKGVVKGTSATTFDPDDKVTREQLATILYRYAAYKKYLLIPGADLTKYIDRNDISSYAMPAIGWAVEIGLIKGVTNKTVDPGGSATREQFAAIIGRFDRCPFAIDSGVELPEVPIE